MEIAEAHNLSAVYPLSGWYTPSMLGNPHNYLVRAVGLEPTTSAFQVRHSIHLSYALTGASGQNRTADLRITKPLLYQLSYGGMVLEWGVSLYHLPTQRGSRQPTRSVDRLILGRDDMLCRVFHEMRDTTKKEYFKRFFLS